MPTDMQSKHVLKPPHFTRSHVERNLRLRSTFGLLYACDIHPHHYSPHITTSRRNTLTRNVMPALIAPHSEHLTVSLVQTDTSQAYRQQLTAERTDSRRAGADSKAITRWDHSISTPWRSVTSVGRERSREWTAKQKKTDNIKRIKKDTSVISAATEGKRAWLEGHFWNFRNTEKGRDKSSCLRCLRSKHGERIRLGCAEIWKRLTEFFIKNG